MKLNIFIFPAVCALREQDFRDFDVCGAYLQGVQRADEQVAARPPVGFREWDERGIEIFWLMSHPLYGQADAGAIWNRTWNDYVTEEPPGCAYERCPQEPCVYAKRLGDSTVSACRRRRPSWWRWRRRPSS